MVCLLKVPLTKRWMRLTMNLFRKRERVLVDILSAADCAKIAEGFFVCVSAAGRRTLGHNGPNGMSWQVTRPTSMTPEQIRQLPIVRLKFAVANGLVQMAGRALVDSSSLDLFDGTVEWGGDD